MVNHCGIHLLASSRIVALRKRQARAAVLILSITVGLMSLPMPLIAESLDFSGYASLGVEGLVSRMDGRMGFAREAGGIGTLNDFSADLGLPAENFTLGILFSVRPLEHHLLRLYGTIPETYNGSNVLSRQLRTQTNVYQPGTEIQSQFRFATFGFGYDLDFLVGPRLFAGMHGDLRYLDLRVRMRGPGTGLEDTITLSELTPCLGAHVQTRNAVPFATTDALGLGGFARITYGMTPNYLNYYDMAVGFCLSAQNLSRLIFVDFKVGYGLQAVTQQNISGRDLEIKRDGVFFAVQAAY
jgi:hypothetical protein